MSNRADAKVQVQQKTLSGSSPKSCLLQRTCGCGQHTITGGECEECRKKREGILQRAAISSPPVGEVPPIVQEVPRFGHDFSQIPVHTSHSPVLQTKLTINQPEDVYEKEADQVAAQVMATPAPHSVSGPLSRIQRYSGQSTGQADAAPASVDQALASPGWPLEPVSRQDMEQRFGYDFSNVRVHTDAKAAESARAVNALAYTVGRDVVFGAGQYHPHTGEGRRLLAHELTHVVQQGSGTSLPASAPLPIDTSGEPAAEQASDKVMSGRSAGHVESGRGMSIQRQPPLLRPPVAPPAPWVSPETFPFSPVFPVPREESEQDELKPGNCGSPNLPITLVSFFPGPLGQGGRVKASPLTRCPGNTRGSKPQDRFYQDQFKCIDAAGKRGDWVRGHILHGETDRSGDRNLHGPGDKAANLIIIDQSLNQAMWNWIEDVVLKLVYGDPKEPDPFPHVLWYDAWVDSYYPGLPFFADSISVEYGRFDTRSGREGPRLNFKQFTLKYKPPKCPAEGFAGGVFPWMDVASTSGFQSSLQICHRSLISRDFGVAYGGLKVATDAKWVGKGPREEPAPAEGKPEGCLRQNYHVSLWKKDVSLLGLDDFIDGYELLTGRREVMTWRELDDDDYYLEIWTEKVDPHCCLVGDITVAPFYSPSPKSQHRRHLEEA